MSELNWDLDAMVDAIMTDLRKNASSSAPVAASLSRTLSRDFASVAKKPEIASTSAPEPRVLNIAERALFADAVARIAASSDVKTWRVRPDAVVTPLALEELKKLGVQLTRSALAPTRVTISASNARESGGEIARDVVVAPSNERKTSEVSEEVRTLIAVCLQGSERPPRGVVEYLARNTTYRESQFDCLKKLTASVAEELAKNGKLRVVVVTHDGAIASIWANRKKGVRAVVAYSAEQAKRDVLATSANVLIFDPRDLGAYQALKTVDFFVNFDGKEKR